MTRSQTQRMADLVKAFGKANGEVAEAMSVAAGIKRKNAIDVVDLEEAAEFCRRMGYRQAAVLLTEFAAHLQG